jgi:hypothetical protein
MFPPNWPSSGVQVVVVKDSAAQCNAVYFPPIVVAIGYFGYVGCTWLLLVLFGLLVVNALNVLAGARILLCVGHSTNPHNKGTTMHLAQKKILSQIIAVQQDAEI